MLIKSISYIVLYLGSETPFPAGIPVSWLKAKDITTVIVMMRKWSLILGGEGTTQPIDIIFIYIYMCTHICIHAWIC